MNTTKLLVSLNFVRRSFSLGTYLQAKVPKLSLKNASASSKQWLTRQLTDPYVLRSHQENYRARSVYKLQEIDQKYKLFRPGSAVLDVGAAPGSWTQYGVKAVNACGIKQGKPIGQIVSVDLSFMDPIAGAVLIDQSDFLASETQQRIVREFGGQKIDLIMSDMAPNASGSKQSDHLNVVKLVAAVFQFSLVLLKPRGSLLCKLWDGSETVRLKEAILTKFATVRTVKPDASRGDSAEIYLLAQNLLPIST